jgi:hypothetical protein
MRVRWFATGTAAGLALLSLVPSAAGAAADTTGPFGQFGFTTLGLGASSSYGEPSIAIAPDGQHVVSSTPGCGGVCYWYSANDGSSFKTSMSTDTNGGGDSELDFLPNGHLLSADLTVANSGIQQSNDFGATWTSNGSAGIEQDRQWLAHSPDGKTEYLVYHDFAAEAEFFARSTDGGVTWPASDAANPITPPGGAPGAAPTPVTDPNNPSFVDQGVNTFSGPMLVDKNGQDLYVAYSISNLESNISPTTGVPPFGPTRGVIIAHSPDGGATWSTVYAAKATPNPTSPSSESTEGAIFPWATLDSAGNIYVLYNATDGSDGTHFHQYYTYSTDKGATFSAPVKVDSLAPNTGSSLYATGMAGAPGVVDVAWYQTDTGTPSSTDAAVTWVPHFAQITAADTKSPVIVGQQTLTTLPNHHGGICLQGILCGIGPGSSDRSLLDFFELAINPVTGLAEIAYADNGGRSGANSGEVVFAKQTSGPSALVAPTVSVPDSRYLPLLPLAAAAVVTITLWRRRRHRAIA